MKTRSGYRDVDGTRVWSTTVAHVYQERCDAGPFYFGADHEDGSLLRVLGSLNKILESIPEQYRINARCEISSESGYEGAHYASITVSYERPETIDETQAREAAARLATERKEKAERAQFEALKKKFG